MHSAFDRRVVPEPAIAFVRACQAREVCHLGGGAALAGAHLSHRLSRDLDLFLHDGEAHRRLVSQLADVAASVDLQLTIVRDHGAHVRASLTHPDWALEVDAVHEMVSDIEPAPTVDGVLVESLTDLRASKLTCLLSRSEPRDLVDVYFLEKAGFPPERDLSLALKKDGGIDPAVLAWLLGQFPVEPLPQMLEPLTVEELRTYRDQLRERFRVMAMP